MTWNCGPGACGTYTGRRYLTKEERAGMLNDYLKELESEAKAVRERIAEIAAA